MRLSVLAILAGTFASAAALALVSAWFSVGLIERASQRVVLGTLIREGMDWAEVDTDGLQVYLFGTAPDEATRFAALSTAGRVVDTTRLIDQMLVEDAAEIAAPAFSIELLRNESGLSVIGLVPTETDRAALIQALARAAGTESVSDFLETADHPAPEHWDAALAFARTALEALPRSKISVDAERIAVTAMTASEGERRRLESALARQAPEPLSVMLDLTAPRPVIAPFALRFVADGTRARFDTCAADTEEARDEILAAATRAGLDDKAECRLGLGVPSRDWGSAAAAGLDAVAALGGGTLTMTNTEIRLEALAGTDPARFDRAVGDLQAAVPALFDLTVDLPPPPESVDAPQDRPEFTATRSPEGAVALRGLLPDARMRSTADSFAKAKFGVDAVQTAARLDPDLPRDWPLRALAALDALALLANGAVVVSEDAISVSGQSGHADVSTRISAIMLDKLGDAARYDIDVAYIERLDPTSGLPTPEECEALIVEIIGERKILFEPGSATLDRSAENILDELADLLKQCGDIPLEIGGHTDSQGRETMNRDLSRDRAQSVRDGLRERRVPVRDYTVVGYGEAQPIADNDTEDGREANRRIEFRLIRPEPVAEEPTGLEQVETAVDGDAPEADSDGETGDGDASDE